VLTVSPPHLRAHGRCCSKYLRKGRKVYVAGRLQCHTYTGQGGIGKTGVEVVLEELVMLDRMPTDIEETSGRAKA
jgi:single-stranded DNA-binding protein